MNEKFIFETDETVTECHAATVAALNDGTLVSAWFAGAAEGKPDVSIWFTRRVGGILEKPKRLSENDGIPHWNPVLFSPDGENLTLFYKSGQKICDWKTFVMNSSDGGKNWSSPKELVAGDESGGRGPVKNKPLITAKGEYLAPASSEKRMWRPFVDAFDGKTWNKRNIPVGSDSGLSLIQPTLWQSKSGSVHALMRSNAGRIYRSDSFDGGKNWSECYPTDMPNNNSGIDCCTVGDKLLLVCNPVAENWGIRSPLTVFLSSDNGKSFKKLFDLEREQGEFSYPSVICKDGMVYIVYTYKRKKIAFCEFEIDF